MPSLPCVRQHFSALLLYNQGDAAKGILPNAITVVKPKDKGSHYKTNGVYLQQPDGSFKEQVVYNTTKKASITRLSGALSKQADDFFDRGFHRTEHSDYLFHGNFFLKRFIPELLDFVTQNEHAQSISKQAAEGIKTHIRTALSDLNTPTVHDIAGNLAQRKTIHLDLERGEMTIGYQCPTESY